MSGFERIPWLAEYLDGADHVDVKSGCGSVSLREFVAGVLSYQPGWMRWLWRVRVHLLSMLGQGKSSVPEMSGLTAQTVPVRPGEAAAFFEVRASDGETFWVAAGEERHLGAALAVIVEPTGDGSQQRFHLLTVVRYNNWAGPIYFNVIRVFHHLVVRRAMAFALSGNDKSE